MFTIFLRSFFKVSNNIMFKMLFFFLFISKLTLTNMGGDVSGGKTTSNNTISFHHSKYLIQFKKVLPGKVLNYCCQNIQ